MRDTHETARDFWTSRRGKQQRLRRVGRAVDQRDVGCPGGQIKRLRGKKRSAQWLTRRDDCQRIGRRREIERPVRLVVLQAGDHGRPSASITSTARPIRNRVDGGEARLAQRQRVQIILKDLESLLAAADEATSVSAAFGCRVDVLLPERRAASVLGDGEMVRCPPVTLM